jgi:hypothetical protein
MACSSRNISPGFCLPLPAVLLLLAMFGCDQGLVPPDIPPMGTISGEIQYVGEWPPAEMVRDLRFVAMRFVPQDTADFLQLNRMAISSRLAYGVESDQFEIVDVEIGTFFFSGVAQQFSPNIISWKPIGLYDEGDGIFQVRAGETTDLTVVVDFDDPPVFPPEGTLGK